MNPNAIPPDTTLLMRDFAEAMRKAGIAYLSELGFPKPLMPMMVRKPAPGRGSKQKSWLLTQVIGANLNPGLNLRLVGFCGLPYSVRTGAPGGVEALWMDPYILQVRDSGWDLCSQETAAEALERLEPALREQLLAPQPPSYPPHHVYFSDMRRWATPFPGQPLTFGA